MSGQSQIAIGKAEGITRQRVSQILRAMGLTGTDGGQRVRIRMEGAAEARHRAAYRMQRTNARLRGVEFRLSLRQWLDFWSEDLARRGRGKDKLAMCRYADAGAYEIGNIYKGTLLDNLKHARLRKV